MKPKCEETQNPKNYRPITCLNTLYKIISAILAQKITSYIRAENILSEEQKGCCKGAKGCKEQLVIDAIVGGQVKRKKRNLAVAWIDYQKAYDSVPHSWLIKVLELYGIHQSIIDLLKKLMSSWSTEVVLSDGQKSLRSKPIPILRGIFQGDTWSPMWFCLAINPLSKLLNQSGLGFQMMEKRKPVYTISHLMYMDDLKLYASNEEELTSLLNITAMFSDDIQMHFSLEKCATLNVIKGRIDNEPKALTLLDKEEIQTLGSHCTYKYLGFRQTLTIDQKSTKQDVEKIFKLRLRKILETELIAKNKIKAINSWCIPILTYSFGVIHWSQTDLDNLNTMIRTTLTKYRMHHPKSSVERLYIPRKQGGRGLLDLKSLCNRQTTAMKKYFLARSETSPLHNAMIMSDKGYSPLNLNDKNTYQQTITANDRIQTWKSKALHGRFPHSLDSADKDASTRWLRDGFLFGETEGFIHAIQDQVIATNNYKKYIEKQDIQDICRICHQSSETIDHLITACSNMANTEYLHRHNLTTSIVHQALALKLGLISDKQTCPYYEYKARPTMENQHYKLYYDIPIHTDKCIAANRPDIILHNMREKHAIFIDVTHPADHNINKAESEKISKYIPLAIEYKEMYKLNSVKIIPIVITATGLVNKNLKKYLETLGLDPNIIIPKAQKSVILETCRIVRTVLNQY